MYAKIFLFIVVSSLYIACTDGVSNTENNIIRITSPRTDWNYYENRIVQLSMNVKSSDISWYSDYDGYLGFGNGFFVSLRKGLHRIEANYNGSIYSIDIEIKQDIIEYLEERRFLINQVETQINMTEGIWYPAIISYDGTAIGFNYENPVQKLFNQQNYLYDNYFRDFHIPVDNLQNLKSIQNTVSMRIANYSYNIGSEKTIYVLRTNAPLDVPYDIHAHMIYSGSRYTIWKDYWEPIDEAALAKCIENLDNIIMPRLLRIWGEWTDVDGDGKVAIMFSKTINLENIATGFFYPKDMFSLENDPDELSYNPDSNEMDIIYVAYPITGSSTYNPEVISATIAHELTHLITFSQKTYNKILNNNGEINRETVFLEEGWSHLSENLCGFGVSGGNIMFLKRYLDDMASYSFCAPNAMGQTDSAGMRGAMTLFLSWLFWKNGGMDWHPTNPGIVYDRGGITFLRELINSDSIGWPSIGRIMGRSIDELFTEFIYDLNRQRITGTIYNYRTDPHTNEPIEFYNNMGTIFYRGNPYLISAGTHLPPNNPYNTLPWSFSFLEPMITKDEYILNTSTSFILGKVLLSFIKGN